MDPLFWWHPCQLRSSFIFLAEENENSEGFAGRKVIEGTINQQLPENFQRADHLLSCGFIDAIVHRKDLPEKLSSLLSILLKKKSEIKV